jgi:hypothetical protein
MAKTFLQLAQRLRQEVSGSGTGPSTTVGQTGELKRLIDWIVEADEEVQQEHDEWKFMVGSFTLDTVASDNSYLAADCITPITDLRNWRIKTFKSYLLSSGTGSECKLSWMDYQEWYDRYNTGAQSNSQPTRFTIGNDMSIKLAATPDAVYRVSGEYQKSVTTLTNNADAPIYPAEFHMLPVYGGMMKHGLYVGAPELYQKGELLYNKMMRRMERSQLPRVNLARPLA